MNNLGMLLHTLGRTGEAEQWIRHAASGDTHVADIAAHNLDATRAGIPILDPSAEPQYRRAAADGDTDAMNNLGMLLHILGQTEEAEEWIRHAAEHGNTHAMNNLGALLHAAGHTEEAEQWIRRAANSGTPPP